MGLFRKTEELLDEHIQIQEIDERHHLSQQIYFRREAVGWSQEGLAGRAGMTQAQIAQIEAGQMNPTLRTLVKLARALSCGVADLLAGP